jgi:RNA polymerase sigma factor (sigma-70 family)
VAEQHDDQLLRRRLSDGDQSVLESILRAYGPKIEGWLRKKYRQQLDREEIRDVLSSALCRLWNVRAQYDPAKSSLRSFFQLLADHEAIDVIRSAWHRARTHEVRLGDLANGIADRAPSAPADFDPAPDNGHTKMIRDLRTCMDSLNESSRRILLNDASGDDSVPRAILAQQLSLSQSGIRVARKRGLDKLREAMKKLGY